MAEKLLITSLKSMEEATSFSIERTSRLVNMPCDIVPQIRFDQLHFAERKFT
jgi:hypothetical protein